jgi:hypothetical protein
VQLVIQAGAIGGDGHALVLDMGEPVKIYDVARQLASARTEEIAIEFTGLRPGEKMHEDLFCSAETPTRSAHELIRYVDVPTLEPDRVRDLDPTGTHAEVVDILVTLVADIDDRTGRVTGQSNGTLNGTSVDELSGEFTLDLIGAEIEAKRAGA